MKFTITQEQWTYFHQSKAIEFEGLLSNEEIDLLNQNVEQALSKRLGVKPDNLDKQQADKLFEAGRDLWRISSPLYKNIICQNRLGTIASQLVDEKPLRLGYDQFFPSPNEKEQKGHYEKFLHASPTLKEISCFQGILCGLLFCLSESQPNSLENEKGLFPKIPGNGVFLAPDKPIPFQKLEHPYYLIAYTRANSVYVFKREDPHAHALKQLGYSYGDRLSDEWHPIIFK